MVQALLENEFVQLQISDDLLQPLIFLLQRLHLGKLWTPNPTKLLAPIIIGLVRNPSLATRANNIKPIVQMYFDLAQYLQRILIRISLACQYPYPLSLNQNGTVLGG